MIGLQEIGIALLFVLVVVLFGKRAVIKAVKDFFSLKKEISTEITKDSLNEQKQ